MNGGSAKQEWIEPRHTFSARLECPSCGLGFEAEWHDLNPASQQCPGCGHAFEAAWPGWKFKPEVTVRRYFPGQPGARPGNNWR